MRKLIFAALMTMVTAGPALASDKMMIQALDDQFSDAAARGDVEALAKMYAPDATILPMGGPMAMGQDGARAVFGAAVKGVAQIKLTADDVVRIGPDYIREVGTSTLVTKGAQPQTNTGKYVVVWHLVDGNWKLWTDIWN